MSLHHPNAMFKNHANHLFFINVENESCIVGTLYNLGAGIIFFV